MQIYQNDSCMGGFWNKEVVKLKFFSGSMDSKKYIDILESSSDKMNLILPNRWILQWDNDSKYKSKDSPCFYKNKLMKWPAYIPELNLLKAFGENSALFWIKNIWKYIKLKKKIEDKLNQIDHNFCKKLINSVKRRRKFEYLEGALTGY